MEVVIEGLNHTGEGIGRIDGKVVFVPNSIPGDVVDIVDLKDFKTYYRGSVGMIITSSNDRVEQKCPYYGVCGGCQLRDLSYLKQLEYKKDKVKNVFKKYGNIDVDVDIIGCEKKDGYRNKITLQVKDGKLGLYNNNSNDLICVDKCMLVSDKVNEIIKLIKDNLDLNFLKNVMIREYNGRLMIQFIGNIDKDSAINCLSSFVDIIYINELLIYGKNSLEVMLDKYKYKVSPYSFFQVNYEQATKLYDKVKEYLGNDNNSVLDLYCGTGSIGIYVSSCCKRILGIEINESSVRDANVNIGLNDLDNVSVIKGSVGKVLKSGEEYDAIIVDPPRSGLDKNTRNTLLEIGSKKIIYVSCDPITLARDLKELGVSYGVKDLVLVDMFPNTYHVESVVLLELKK